MNHLKLVLVLYFFVPTGCSDVCVPSSDTCNIIESPLRFILYDVNHPEGFNLRRDVYIRLAVFVKQLKTFPFKYHLVLPPWNNLPHWRSQLAVSQFNLPWSLFFDIKSLQSYAPVMEAYEFFEDFGGVPALDHVIVLQHFEDLWSENFTWTNKWAVEECHEDVPYYKNVSSGIYRNRVQPDTISAKELHCVSFQGPTSLLEKVLDSFDGKSLLFEHAEVVLHDHFGDDEYWECRKSMKFADHLIKIGSDFRHSAFEESSTTSSYDTMSSSEGGPYLCVHFRRRDYLISRSAQTPSVPYAVRQIKPQMGRLNLTTLFVATDTYEAEFQELSNQMLPYKTVRYRPSSHVLQTYKDGGVAIIEQIVCSHAKYFIGSFESTFSFRIQEERELLNFPPDTTFNRLCGDNEQVCKPPTRWLKPR